MKYLFIFLILLSLTVEVTNANITNTNFENSDSLINRANSLNDSGDYHAALKLLCQVSKADPNYARACYEMALNYFYMSDYETSYSKCKEAQFLNYDEPFVYSLMGSALDNMNRPDDGIMILVKALKKWPYNQNLIYNLGVCYLNAGKPDSAEQIIKKIIVFYPYHTRSHLALANANYAMGRITEAYLAYSMAILINPGLNNIKELEEIINGDSKITPRPYLYPYQQNYNHQNYDFVKYLLQSEFAFNKNLDFNYDLDYTFSRQSLLLFSNIKYDPSDSSFYNRFYVRLFSSVYSQNMFETYLNYCMKNLNNKTALTWDEKNPGKITAFIKWAQNFIDNGRSYGFYPQYEDKKTTIHHFNENGTLISVGKETGDIKNGFFITISTNGSVTEAGNYVNNITEGKWVLFWPDGKIKQDLNFTNDKIDGTIYTYHPNGSKSWIYNFNNGIKNGVFEEYTASGNLSSKNIYVNDRLEGKGIFYNYKEGFKREFVYLNDTLNGITREEWLCGNPKTEYTLVKGNYDGKYKTWYPNGNILSESFYSKDIKTGSWRNVHFNGITSDSGAYNNEGEITGSLKSFNRKGQLISFESEYEKDTLNGFSDYYFDNGKVQTRQKFEKNKLISLESFDGKGKLLYNQKASGDSLYYKNYYSDGNLMNEGLLVNGKKEGLWKSYDDFGLLINEKHYKDGLLSGSQKSYFNNGRLMEDYSCDSNDIIGIYKSFHKNGHLESIGKYNKQGANGEWINYYSNDTISERSFYVNGNSTGTTISYNPDGRIESEILYNNEGLAIRSIFFNSKGEVEDDLNYEYGSAKITTRYSNGEIKNIYNISENVNHGIQEYYYPNGQLSNRSNYIFGKIHGDVVRYDYKGNIDASYSYLFGKLNGELKYYRDNLLDYKANYQNGVMEGSVVYYYDNGKVSCEFQVSDGQNNGYKNYYAPDGTFMYRLRYENDVVKGCSWKNNSGNFVPEIIITEKTKEIITYYPRGSKSAVINFSKGMLHGKCYKYYPDGKILKESEFAYNDYTGENKEYFPGGKLKEVENYTDDEKNGIYKLYYSNGNLALSGNYIYNNKNGIWHVYNEKGEETDILNYNYGQLNEITKKQ